MQTPTNPMVIFDRYFFIPYLSSLRSVGQSSQSKLSVFFVRHRCHSLNSGSQETSAAMLATSIGAATLAAASHSEATDQPRRPEHSERRMPAAALRWEQIAEHIQ